jgi:hypothetical protein
MNNIPNTYPAFIKKSVVKHLNKILGGREGHREHLGEGLAHCFSRIASHLKGDDQVISWTVFSTLDYQEHEPSTFCDLSHLEEIEREKKIKGEPPSFFPETCVVFDRRAEQCIIASVLFSVTRDHSDYQIQEICEVVPFSQTDAERLAELVTRVVVIANQDHKDHIS